MNKREEKERIQSASAVKKRSERCGLSLVWSDFPVCVKLEVLPMSKSLP